MNEAKESMIIEAAYSVFLRYGYKRVTMHDIAEVVGISRPAIYILFPNKEAIFKAVIRKMNVESLEKIRRGIVHHTTGRTKLLYAFEMWTIEPFKLIKSSPDAAELIYSAYQLAADVLNESGLAFEELLVTILNPIMSETKRKNFSPKKIAHILRIAVRGFKEVSQSVDELRQVIKDFIDLVLQNSEGRC